MKGEGGPTDKGSIGPISIVMQEFANDECDRHRAGARLSDSSHPAS